MLAASEVSAAPIARAKKRGSDLSTHFTVADACRVGF